jgi:hypothetical protein
MMRQSVQPQEDAADDRTGALPDAGRADDQCARQPGALLGQNGVGHAEDGRPHQRAADAHQGACDDEHDFLLRQASQK